MTTRICHVFDGQTGWEQRLAVRLLVDRLPADQFQQQLVAISPRAILVLRHLDRDIRHLACPFLVSISAAPQLGPLLAAQGTQIVHAWGVQAALTARIASNLPVVLHMFDPAVAQHESKLLTTLDRPGKFAIVCSSEVIRRRLVEGGMPLASCPVIRPGVDFELINRFRRGSIRARLGLAPQHVAIAIPPVGHRDVGHLEALWGTMFAGHFLKNARLLVKGRSPTTDRLVRLARALPYPDPITLIPDDIPYEAVISVSDALAVGSEHDTSTSCIAWAMAAGARIIGSATYSVAELISNKLNGRLFKQEADENAAIPIARLLLEEDKTNRLTEVARGHAYEVFSAQRCADQHAVLYSNILEGRSPAEGLLDSAIAT